MRVGSRYSIAIPAGSHTDVASVAVSVAGEDADGVSQDPLATTDLSHSQSGWSGTLTGVTIGPELTFTAEAFDASNTKLFSGTKSVILGSASDQVVVGLTVVDDGSAQRIPVVTAVSVGAVQVDASAAVGVSVTGAASEALAYQFANGTFSPSSGTVTTASDGTATISSTYQAPATAGRYVGRVQVENTQGNQVEVDFEITVAAASGSETIVEPSLGANLGPVVEGLTGKRVAAGVRWTAAVSTQGDGAGVTFSWTFSGTATFAVATTNPATMTGYDETTTGTIGVSVTDAAGLVTSASLVVPAGMFPDALRPPAAELVINEIDYEQAGVDENEFIEIWNPGTTAVDLASYRIDLVNGSDGQAYASYSGTGQLAAGGVFVIADQAVIDLLTVGVGSLLLKSAGLQNGPDGIRIVVGATGRVVDSVYYEGVVEGAGHRHWPLRQRFRQR